MQPRRNTRTANTLIVAGSYLLSNVTGFGTRLLIANNFPLAQTDAFWTAFRIPDLLFMLLAGGALASAFIPAYTARLAQHQPEQAWALAKRIALIVFGVMACVAGSAAVFAPQLVAGVVAPSFAPDKIALTVALMRIMLIGTVIFSVSGLLMGVLQSNEMFLAPALAPAAYQLGMVFGATALGAFGIYGVAMGAVLGALLHLGVQLPALFQEMMRWGDRENLPHRLISSPPQISVQQDVRQVLRQMPPRMAGNSAVEVNRLVNSNLASGMGSGSASALSNAWAILILPQAVIGQAISTVLFPAISAHAAKGDMREFAAVFSRALNLVVALSAPAAVGLVLLGQPLIRLLFQRGQFGAQATQQVAFALAWFALGLVAHAALELVTRAFYALKDSRTPAWFSVVSVALNILLSIAGVAIFRTQGWLAFGGLALALSVATTLETLALLVVLQKKTPALKLRSTGVALGKSGLAAAGMGLVLMGWLRLFGDSVWATLGAVLVGIAAYFLGLVALRSSEIHPLKQMLLRRKS